MLARVFVVSQMDLIDNMATREFRVGIHNEHIFLCSCRGYIRCAKKYATYASSTITNSSTCIETIDRNESQHLQGYKIFALSQRSLSLCCCLKLDNVIGRQLMVPDAIRKGQKVLWRCHHEHSLKFPRAVLIFNAEKSQAHPK